MRRVLFEQTVPSRSTQRLTIRCDIPAIAIRCRSRYKKSHGELVPYEIPCDIEPHGVSGDLDQHVSEVLLAYEILVGRSFEVSESIKKKREKDGIKRGGRTSDDKLNVACRRACSLNKP